MKSSFSSGAGSIVIDFSNTSFTLFSISRAFSSNSVSGISSPVRSQTASIANADQFSIYIDPFSNGQVEYELMVSAAGVQSDAKITTSSVDKSWDAVWNSSVKINDNGWFLEIFKCPFSSCIRNP